MSRFGELLGGNKAAPTPAPAPEPTPAPEPVVEEVTTEDEVVVVDLDTMSKRELEAYGRKHGVELDRRHSRTKLVEELKDHLSNS
jgi:hypothetical protein